MEELVKYIVNNLVDDMSCVEVNSQEQDGVLVINILAEKSEIGKIIGKQGRIAKALRTLVKAGSKGKKVSVDIIEKE